MEVLAEIPQLQLVEKLCDPKLPDGPVNPDLWELGALHVRCSSCRHQTAESAVAAHRLLDEVDRALCLGIGPGLTPAIRAVKGCRSRREFLPGDRAP